MRHADSRPCDLLPAVPPPCSPPRLWSRAAFLLALPFALLLLGACSSGGGGGGAGNVQPDKSDWDSLVWDQDAWK